MALFIKSASLELDVENLLFALPLLRLSTDGAAALEAGGDIVRSAVSTTCKGILRQCKHSH